MSNALWFAKQPPVPSIVLSSLDYTVQAEWMGKLDPVSDSVFDPSVDNYLAGTRGLARSIMVFGTYAHHAYHANINDLSDPRLTAWRQHLLPGDLSALGYNYLYIDQTWWNDLINLQQQRISNPQHYTLIEEWSDESSGEFRRLHQIVGQATLADQEPFVSYFSPENQNLFKEHAPSFALEPDAVIFDPRTGSSLVQKGFIMNIVEVIENTPLSSAERHALFDLIMLFDQAQFEVDLPARSDYSTQITAWRSSKLPEPLQALSIDYLLVDDEWLGWLTPEEVDILSNSSYYELVQAWELPGIRNRYLLYRVIG
jgi:hypothetical protein